MARANPITHPSTHPHPHTPAHDPPQVQARHLDDSLWAKIMHVPTGANPKLYYVVPTTFLKTKISDHLSRHKCSLSFHLFGFGSPAGRRPFHGRRLDFGAPVLPRGAALRCADGQGRTTHTVVWGRGSDLGESPGNGSESDELPGALALPRPVGCAPVRPRRAGGCL